MKNPLVFIFFIFFVHKEAFAQKQTQRNTDSIFSKFADLTSSKFSPSNNYYIVHWNNYVDPSMKIIRNLTDSLSIVLIENQNEFALLSRQVRIAPANSAWKLSPPAEKEFGRKKAYDLKFILITQNIDDLLQVLQNHKHQVNIIAINKPSNSVVIKCKQDYFQKYLLELKEIIFVDLLAEAHPETSIIGYDRSFHGINAVDYLIPNANGKNIVAGVKEQKMDETDIDLLKRVLPSSIAHPANSFHATVIASIIGGAGNSSYAGKGIAWKCLFFPSSFSNLFADDATILNANKVTVQNHSYGTIIQQFYGAEAVSYDVLTWNNKNFIPVMSSGNQGDGFATEGKYANLKGFANLTGNFKMAKNVITVAAIDNEGNVPVQSSAGPLYDGRIAPQLTALGPSGTSDAAAIVTGTVAVIQQVYSDSTNNTLPPASLVKAILYNTADDIYKPGIDYKTGYGLLNSYEAVRSIQQKNYDGAILFNAQEWQKNIPIPANISDLKITLAWTDSAASVNNNKALINDLDLEVIEENTGKIFQPWVLSSASNVDSLTKEAIQKRDSLNTAEQVSIHLPAEGTYRIKVKGTSLSAFSVPFHVAYKLDTLNTFMFISPLHASDVTGEKLNIRWKTFFADTNQTGNLYISYDNGINWQQIASSVKLISKKYSWLKKDTTSIAQLKMETPFGNFVSSPFIISKITSLQLDFNCADSFRLSWNKHVYATGYRIYALVDSPYLKPILTITDTFAVLRSAQYPSRVYAVEPILSNGVAAARSGAQNIDLLGVNCFYRTLNYNLLDTNKLNLILELSSAALVDSISFEQVTATGELVQTYGGTKVSISNLIYTHLVNEVPAGITYLRARIKLKNGSIVYTDILTVLTSGRKYVLFYPNPVARNGRIKYVLQQGISADNLFQLYDMYGRLLKNYSSMPNEIDVTGLPSGMIIYKLFDGQNKILETGKLIIL